MKKLYYSISEISELLQEEQHTLRYWEKEFDMLKPKKNSAGNRIYSYKDIEMLQRIKKLIREDNLNTFEAYDILAQETPKKGAPVKKAEEAPKPEKENAKKENIIPKNDVPAKPKVEPQTTNISAPTKIEAAKTIIAPEPKIEKRPIFEDFDVSDVEVKEGEMYSLFGAQYDPKISIKKSELQKLYNALAECLEELKNN